MSKQCSCHNCLNQRRRELAKGGQGILTTLLDDGVIVGAGIGPELERLKEILEELAK